MLSQAGTDPLQGTPLYNSGPISDYPYNTDSSCNGYSPDVPVTISGLDIDVANPHLLTFVFTNNARNVHLRYDMSVCITWAGQWGRSSYGALHGA